jgi:hypothetical protein
MKPIFDNEDEILGLVRQEGLLKPSEGFTSQVMQYLEEKKENAFAFQPLISKRTWIILISLFGLLSIVCWQVFAKGTNEEGILDNTYNKIAGYFSNFNFAVEINSNTLLIITLAMICMGILLLIDLWFSNNNKRLEA